MRTEFQDLNCTNLYRLPARATLIPYPDTESARQDERAMSPYYLGLNGEWDFTYYNSPYDVEELSGEAGEGIPAKTCVFPFLLILPSCPMIRPWACMTGLSFCPKPSVIGKP